MERVCRNGLMEGVNCGEMELWLPATQKRGGGQKLSFSKHLVDSYCVSGTALGIYHIMSSNN